MLYAFNQTAADEDLAAGNPIRTIPASADPPNPGSPVDVTAELWPDKTVDAARGRDGGLDAAAFALLETQRLTGDIRFEWDGQPDYGTGTLVISGPAPGLHAGTHEGGGTDPIPSLPTSDQAAALDAASPALDAANPPLSEKDERIRKLSTASREYFVDTVSGDDSNSGLAGFPWKSMNRAIVVLEAMRWVDPFVLHAPGAHVLTPEENLHLEIWKRKGCIIDGGPNVTVVLDDGGSPFTSDISTAGSIGYSGLALSTDLYEGYQLRIYSGPAAGIWSVRSHDGDTFVPTAKGGFPAPPGAVQFDIVRPESTIEVSGPPFDFETQAKSWKVGVEGDGFLWLQRFTLTGNCPLILTAGGDKPTVNVAACVIDKGAQLVTGNLFRWALFGFFGDGAFVSGARDPSVMGAGTALADNFAGTGVVGGPGSIYFFDGLIEWSQGRVDFFDFVTQQMTFNATPGIGARVREGTKASVQLANSPIDLVTPWYDCFFKGFVPFGAGSPTTAGLWATGSAVTLGESGKGPVDCSDGVGGVYARDSKIRIEDGLTGTGNTGFGVEAVDGSEVYFENSAAIAAMALSGADGEASLDGEIDFDFADADGEDLYEPRTSSAMRIQSRLGQ